MKILKLANYLFKSLLRDKSSFFWLLVFPTFLLVIMMIIFPPLYEPKSVTFDLTLISYKGMFADIIGEVFKEVSRGENKVFQLKTFQNSQENLEKGLRDLKAKRTNLVIEVPESFDGEMLNWFMLQSMGARPPSPHINIYSLRHQASSEAAYIIVENIFQKLELEFIKKIGYQIEEVKSDTEVVGTKDTFSFIDFIYPGIVIFVVFMTCLFGIGTDMAWLKEKGIMRRINVTTLPSLNFIISYIISRLYLIVLQIILVTLIAKFIFNTTVNPFSLPFIGYTLLTIVCLSTFGFFISSISKTTSSANAITQVLNFPMQFLGGLYFPVANVSWFIKWIVLINPITYLASGIRDSLGILKSPYPLSVNIIIPILWTMFCLFFTIKKFNQEEW